MSITASNNPFACEPVVFANTNAIVSLGTITRVGNQFTFSVGFVWKINGVTYQNTSPVVITIAEASDGNYRIDNALLTTTNTIELQQGVESTSVALRPVAPNTSVVLTSWNVSGSSISTPDPAILGTNYLKKDYENSQTFYGPTTGTDYVIGLNNQGRNHIILTGSMKGCLGFGLANITANPSNSEFPHQGKDYYIQNKTDHPVMLIVDQEVELAFKSIDGNDIKVPVGGIVHFKKNGNFLEEFFRSWSVEKIPILQNKTQASYTGTTTETIIGTPILIPANTIKQNDLVQVAGIFQFFTTGETNTNWNIKIYISPEFNIQSGQVIYSPSNNNTPNNTNILSHNFETPPYLYKDGDLIGSNIRGLGTNNYVLNSAVDQNGVIYFDPTIDNYLFATGILQNAGTILAQQLLQIKIY